MGCVCGTDIPMSVGIVEPKTHPSQLNAAEFLWDMKKRTSVFVQVFHTSSLCVAPAGHRNNSPRLHNHLLGLSLPVCCLNCSRCTASALSSLPGSTVERRAFHSGSRLTPSPWETLESTRSTSTLPPAKSKSLRCPPIPSWVELGGVSQPSLSLKVTITTLLPGPCLAKRGRSEAKDGPREDGEAHSPREGKVPAFLRYHYPFRGQCEGKSKCLWGHFFESKLNSSGIGSFLVRQFTGI